MKLNRNCPRCNADVWEIVDDMNEYYEYCAHCGLTVNKTVKSDLVDNFQCSECNCLDGKIEENKKLLAMRCKHCGKQVIILEKHTTLDNRSEEVQHRGASSSIFNILRCPKCHSTSVTTGARGYKLLTGFLGSNQTVNRCGSCGHTWKPGR